MLDATVSPAMTHTSVRLRPAPRRRTANAPVLASGRFRRAHESLGAAEDERTIDPGSCLM
jgi:hypothetical protein